MGNLACGLAGRRKAVANGAADDAGTVANDLPPQRPSMIVVYMNCAVGFAIALNVEAPTSFLPGYALELGASAGTIGMAVGLPPAIVLLLASGMAPKILRCLGGPAATVAATAIYHIVVFSSRAALAPLADPRIFLGAWAAAMTLGTFGSVLIEVAASSMMYATVPPSMHARCSGYYVAIRVSGSMLSPALGGLPPRRPSKAAHPSRV